MAGAGILDGLRFRSESDSESESESESDTLPLDSEFDSEANSDVLEPDPAPKRRARMSAAPAPKVTAAVRKRCRETLVDMVELPVSLWALRDPHCAGVAQEQTEPIVDALMNFVVKRPSWVAALGDLDESMDVIRLVKATYPLVMAIVAHHVTRTAQPDEGVEDDLSAYAAPSLR